MSIVIKNVPRLSDEVYAYTMRINDGPILAEFPHIRDDGLACLLRRAADALDRRKPVEERGDG